MKRRQWLVFLVASPMLACPIACKPHDTICDDIANDARDILRACHADPEDVDLGPTDDEHCKEKAVARDECILHCYQSATCAAFLNTNPTEHDAFKACLSKCGS